ncbi:MULTISPECIES: hypothetical protein [Pseudomonas]|uniref:Chemotaxis protein n=1 Tax=Pseudomonas luteola TaxID=47886 RepID=A0ABS0FPJ2_PSELU|nr:MULTISPECIES: hypothetical protein [Pseudomonas]MBF8642278.1 hypothetical protein [Pseudomonas zeshuii]RRW48339.1 hypothetical protein EGJ50_10285 [Pseudomonas luteola]SHJ24234.1 hypothetical protein SAMN05216295_109216 [Pseudomonas zeshuii]
MDPNDLAGGNPAGWLTAGGIGLAWGLNWLRKYMSSTGASVANDRAEKDMLERTLAQNEKLNSQLEAVTKERNDMYRTVGELTGTLKAMKSQLDLQESHISQLTSEVAQLRQALQRSGHERRNGGDQSQALVEAS